MFAGFLTQEICFRLLSILKDCYVLVMYFLLGYKKTMEYCKPSFQLHFWLLNEKYLSKRSEDDMSYLI